ncbi:hypothetical protein [Streptomyces lavendulae]|uniref:hypothetical protein n=1 Tax=Streptomyces lavendulae TaxID=1914 RepID=UPI003CD05677
MIERNAMRRADVITDVGELLTVEARRLSEQVVRVPALHEFVPGAEIGERVRGPPMAATRSNSCCPCAPLTRSRGSKAPSRRSACCATPPDRRGSGCGATFT